MEIGDAECSPKTVIVFECFTNIVMILECSPKTVIIFQCYSRTGVRNYRLVGQH